LGLASSLNPFLSIKEYYHLMIDIVVTLSAIVGLTVTFGTIFKEYWWLVAIVIAIVFSIPWFFKLRQPKLFKEYGLNPTSPTKEIIIKESVNLDVTQNEATVKTSRTYLFLRKPEECWDIIEAKDEAVKSFGAKALNYDSEADLLRFERKGPDQYLVFWKPKRELFPLSVYRHTYTYIVPNKMIGGIRYIFVISTKVIGHLELSVTSFKPFLHFECFCTSEHPRTDEEVAEAIVLKPKKLHTLSHRYDRIQNKLSISVQNPVLGVNYYVVWSHDNDFESYLRKLIEDKLKIMNAQRRHYLSFNFYKTKKKLKRITANS
jgi:hypothetical protein